MCTRSLPGLLRTSWTVNRCGPTIRFLSALGYPHLRAEVYTRESIALDEAFIPVGELCGNRWSWEIKRHQLPPPVTPIDVFDDYRGLTEAEAEQIIRPLVDDMFNTLKLCGAPFMRELAESMCGGSTLFLHSTPEV